jgi:Ca2+-binding EF-hand superfamily protein
MQFKRFWPAVVIAGLVAPWSGHAEAQGGQARRFAEMDRNNDGVVTRTEWRGNDRSFRNHDWNGDGVLSGDEVRPGAVRRNRPKPADDFDSPDREYELNDWTEANFRNLDHNRDNRLTRDEWHFDRESFRRADHDGDGVISRPEFLGGTEDDDREDRFRYLDENGDGRIARGEWHGAAARFDALDDNRDGFISRAEALGSNEPPPDLFSNVDVNGDGAIVRDEWHWSRASFDQRDANRDGRLSRDEFTRTTSQPKPSNAYRAGFDRGLTEGRAAGREDRERNQGWDLEGQRELETADSGYQAQVGPRAEYQAGYRDGFRRGYKEGWGK